MNVTEISFIIKDTLVGLPHIFKSIIIRIFAVVVFSVEYTLAFLLMYLAGVCDLLFDTNLHERVEYLFK